MNTFDEKVRSVTGGALRANGINTFQVNVGLVCNLECVHCHVNSSPRRKEIMPWETMEHILSAAERARPEWIDITGGAPEMNPHFRRFVDASRDMDIRVMVRTNLTIMLEPGYEDLPGYFKDRRVTLVASLPCYLEENVDRQRGGGVYKGSVEAIRRLNAIGYGIDPDLPLNLVYNPLGPSLPPSQPALEADYRRELLDRYGIHFTHLHTITNMPIGRFKVDLKKAGRDREYMNTLVDAFNPETLEGLMCRRQISIDWNGDLYDCDFNLAIRLRMNHGAPNHISRFDEYLTARREIVTGEHCFGCTAGCGSSCGGALVTPEAAGV